MNSEEARKRFATSPVARLATISARLRPHLVPIVFAVAGEIVYTSVDAKPKTTTALRRLDNIAANPAVAVLVDRYDDDWAQLWWARADGDARLAHGAEAEEAIRRLTARYPHYERRPPPGPVIAIEVARWSGWSAS
ncbi:TIGR03668 family PPOX class F420-dependent oxidoreductase [Nocardia niwae]|uniref:TIGR03668 family PPOX class F420-dependent oxidoreductase n=1 Tax=Nocardia niwae TaxID=626084 RepID=A0ABV2XGV4_9NOCA|nr:TIGR03668 family PPOX class F420-dependent oxidoreductase [Nocardia niwae]